MEVYDRFAFPYSGILEMKLYYRKCRNTIECIFTALNMFDTNFLNIARNAQSVSFTNSIHDSLIDISSEFLWFIV